MSVSEWREVHLGDVATVTKLAGFEFTKYIKYTDDGEIIAIRALNVKNGMLDLSEIKRIDKAVSDSLTRSKLFKNDIVLTYTGAKFGEVAIIKYNNKYHLAPNVAKVTAGKECYPYFLFSFLRSDYFRHQLINFSGGSSQPTIPMMAIRQLSVPLPSLPEQKAIAATMSALDDMIELNNQINKNLEEMAQAIFKSWFVDFEPFKNGEFEESELGLIPKGWKVAALDEIADFLNGLAMQKYPPPSSNEKGLPVLKIRELRQGFLDDNSDICSENIDKTYIVDDGDVIFSWSGSLLVDIWCGGRCGLNQHLFKVTSTSYNKWFYYMWTCYHLNEFIAIANDKATTMGHIQRKHLSEAKVLIPEPNTLSILDSVMRPIIDLVISNKVEIKILSTIRNTLLPKLMTGEIRVPVEGTV